MSTFLLYFYRSGGKTTIVTILSLSSIESIQNGDELYPGDAGVPRWSERICLCVNYGCDMAPDARNPWCVSHRPCVRASTWTLLLEETRPPSRCRWNMAGGQDPTHDTFAALWGDAWARSAKTFMISLKNESPRVNGGLLIGI